MYTEVLLMKDLKSQVRALKGQQFDEDSLKNLLKDIQNLKGDDEAIKAHIDKVADKLLGTGYHPRTKAYLTDRLLQQVIGTSALQEIPGLAEKEVSPKTLERLQKEVYGNISELEKVLGLNPNIQIADLESAGMYIPSKGVILNKAYMDPELISQALGTLLHEGSHKADTVSTAIQAHKLNMSAEDVKKLKTKYDENTFSKIVKKVEEGIYDPQVTQFFKDANIITLSSKEANPDIKDASLKKITELVQKYNKETPEKLSDKEEILSWRSKPHVEEDRFLKNLEKSGIKDINSASPLQLQEVFSGSKGDHWFQKNFPLEGALAVAKKGIKGVRSFAPIAAKAGIPLLGAYSSYSEAKDEGMSTPAALAYTAAEELNPLPISGMDLYKGMEKAAEGRRKNIESMYMPDDVRAEQKALESYRKSPAAQSKAFSDLRKFLETEENEELLKEILKKE